MWALGVMGGCPVWYPAGMCRCACDTSGGNASVCDVNGCCASGNDANGCDVKWMWYVMKDVAMGPAAMAKDSPVLANRSEEANRTSPSLVPLKALSTIVQTFF